MIFFPAIKCGLHGPRAFSWWIRGKAVTNMASLVPSEEPEVSQQPPQGQQRPVWHQQCHRGKVLEPCWVLELS